MPMFCPITPMKRKWFTTKDDDDDDDKVFLVHLENSMRLHCYIKK